MKFSTKLLIRDTALCIGGALLSALLVMALVGLMTGCTKRIPPQAPVPVLEPMPEKPAAVKPEANWVVPVESAQDCQDKKGILMSEDKALSLGEYVVAYDGLRTWCQLERDLWSGKWAISQKELLRADQTIEDMSPTWWDENKGVVLFFTGLALGAAVTISVTYAVTQATE